MDSQFLNTIFYGGLAGLATITGIYLLLVRERWAMENAILFVSLSAGVVLTVAFVHLLPEALNINGGILPYVLLTLLVFYILEHLFMIHSCPEGKCPTHPMGWLAFFGIGFHSLMDGMIIGVGFEAGFTLGITATIGVIIHEIPEGITITSLLLHAGFTRGRTITLSWLVALATPIGAIVSYLLFRGIQEGILAILLAVAAGSFIYVGASDLLPETHKDSRRLNILFVIAGGVVAYLAGYILKG